MLALAVSAAAGPAAASNAVLRDVPAASRPAVAAGVAAADEARALLAASTYTEKMAGLLHASGLAALPGVPTFDVAAGAPRVSGVALDAGVARPLADLTAAVDAASRVLGTFSRTEVAAAVAATRGEVATRRELRAGAVDSTVTGMAIPDIGEMGDVPASVRRAIKRLPTAAAIISSALDRAIPQLEAAAGTGASGDVAGCDVVDQTPLLCVGSEANNTYTTDAVVHVDLGGHDVYRTSAGAAPFLPAGGSAYLPVAVAVDLGGDDTYVARALPGWAGFDTTLSQGAAGPGSLGLLVDRRGDDRYLAEAAVPAPGRQGVIVAQGAGFGGGVAALLDGSGNDAYAVTGPTSKTVLAVFAQGMGWNCPGSAAQTAPVGAGAGCSVGGLVDDGGGDDRYVVDVGTAIADMDGRGVRNAYAQASSLFGTGVLSDGGGADVFRISAGSRRTDRLAYDDETMTPSAGVYGQASVIGGTALLLTGDGRTTYDLHVDTEGMALGSVWGQAFGAGGIQTGMNFGDAVAVLDDRGGHDTYTAAMTTHFAPEIVVDDSCRSQGATCPTAEAQVDAFRTAGTSMLHAQASGGFDGLPVLRDRGGNDRYVAAHEVDLDVTLRDRLSAPEGPPVLDVKPYTNTWLYGQAFALCGTSLLLDEDGRDSYDLRANTHTAASATSEHAVGEPQVTALSGDRLAHGQASGLPGFICSGKQMNASLVDLAGTGDVFDVSATSTAATAPDPAGALQRGCCWGSFQGGVGGRFVADGQDVQVRSNPTQGVCADSPGPRGFGSWTNCWQQGTAAERQTYDQIWLYPSAGRVPSAVGTPTSLQLLPETPSAAVGDGTIVAAARLTRADGQPVSGADVDFALQNQQLLWFGVDLGRAWFNVWHVTGVTDADGVARVRLPVTLNQWNPVSKTTYTLDPALTPFQVLATSASDGRLHPAFAARAIALTLPPAP